MPTRPPADAPISAAWTVQLKPLGYAPDTLTNNEIGLKTNGSTTGCR
jgi:hypothetical protein